MFLDESDDCGLFVYTLYNIKDKEFLLIRMGYL
jgi:hypothetical protein